MFINVYKNRVLQEKIKNILRTIFCLNKFPLLAHRGIGLKSKKKWEGGVPHCSKIETELFSF